MKKQKLGGDRLGSGSKMQVELHGFERSTHDLGYIWRSTMSPGTLVPFLVEVALPGDTFDINLRCEVKTHPTVGPLFAGYKVQLDVFQAPLRLYQALLHNNMLGIGMDMKKVKLPTITLTAKVTPATLPKDLNNSQINPSCLLSYLGIRGVGYTTTANGAKTRDFNATAILAYWEIYKNYYANKQEKIGAVIHVDQPAINQTITVFEVFVDSNQSMEAVGDESNVGDPRIVSIHSAVEVTFVGARPDPRTVMVNTAQGRMSLYDFLGGVVDETVAGSITGWAEFNTTVYSYGYQQSNESTNSAPRVVTFDLENIDDMRMAILGFNSQVLPFNIDDDSGNLTPYTWLNNNTNGIENNLSTQEGLAIKTYQSDVFNNWLDSEWIGYISTASAISTISGSITIDAINLAKKVYDMLTRVAVSGGTYDDWLDVQYMHDRVTRAESPIYHGGLIKELVFQEVVSNTATPDQALGTLAGKGVMSDKHKGGHVIVKVDEPGYIIGLVSLTPRIDYSQGNRWDTGLKTIDDLHKPILDEIGFQDLVTEPMAWWTTSHNGTTWVQQSAGKQPAWINYMTNYNRTYGNFAVEENEMFMTLNRRYEAEAVGNTLEIKDLTTYIDPVKYNFIFAETALDAQNFWTQIGVDITARRKMSAKVMPNL